MITIKDHYPVIDQTIQQVKDRFGSDSKIAVMFENCISNTLQTTIKVLDDEMCIRDSRYTQRRQRQLPSYVLRNIIHVLPANWSIFDLEPLR